MWSPPLRKIEYVCPKDKGVLAASADALRCPVCRATYPVVRSIPILIDESSSVFRIHDYTGGSTYGGASGYGGAADSERSAVKRIYRKIYGKLSSPNIPYRFFKVEEAIARVAAEHPEPRILSVGTGELHYDHPGVVHTDVAFGKHVDCICDAHDLPFADGEYDLVIACAVLEHVADPQRCVAEFHRVLRPDGMVYAVTPFLQPVHMAAYDFTRFTFVGHRRLFRYFDDIESGVMGGREACSP
jgi:SAM-dependent methyltransferase